MWHNIAHAFSQGFLCPWSCGFVCRVAAPACRLHLSRGRSCLLLGGRRVLERQLRLRRRWRRRRRSLRGAARGTRPQLQRGRPGRGRCASTVRRGSSRQGRGRCTSALCLCGRGLRVAQAQAPVQEHLHDVPRIQGRHSAHDPLLLPLLVLQLLLHPLGLLLELALSKAKVCERVLREIGPSDEGSCTGLGRRGVSNTGVAPAAGRSDGSPVGVLGGRGAVCGALGGQSSACRASRVTGTRLSREARLPDCNSGILKAAAA